MASYYSEYYTPEYFYKKMEEKKRLKRVGALCGMGLLAYVLIQNVLLLFVQAAGMWEKYTTDSFFQCGIDIILTLAGVLLPFTFINRLMKKYTGVSESLVFERKTSIFSVFLAVVGGAGLCMAANLVSSIYLTIMSLFGINLTAPEVPMPEGSEGFFLSFIRVVVVAAMAEELSLRGYIMGNLKKYGDTFAIGASAALFAIMHGNLVQAPFALMAGFTIGYFTVKTGTLWTGILIHAVNNFVSLVLSYISELAGDMAGNFLTVVAIYGLAFAGIICTLLFLMKNKGTRLSPSDSLLSSGEKISGFFINVPMVLAFLVMFYITLNYIGFGR